ncbi:cytochrome P450 [Stipitochalara longipes BDJ]|nr:cytochrome P450 [Stipitochalara longipes BDJ]
MDISASKLLSLLLVSFLSHRILRIIYRLYFHPLARFPGPKLTAATRWYEFYYQVVKGGHFFEKIDEMHERYGPIVRINPFELHINDSEFYDELYNFNPAFEKRKHENDTGNLQWTAEHNLHQLRRRPYNSFFSTQSVTKLQGFIHSSAEDLTLHFTQGKESGEALDISVLFRCCLADNICDYLFGHNMGFLENPAKGKEFFDFHTSFFSIGWFVLEIPWLINILVAVGPHLPAAGGVVAFAAFQGSLKRELQDIMDGKSEKYNIKRRTIFHEYVEADLPPSIKTPQGFTDDADIFIGAGYETSGHALSTAAFHILDNPSTYKELVSNLRAHWSDPKIIPPWKELENIAYLHATVNEAVRMSLGVSMRLPRVNHVSPVRYGQWEIPPHTIVSMTQRDILFDPTIFTDPYVFKPERWLDPEASKYLDKHLVSFSRGTRGCIGKHLAMAEMHIILATIFRRFDLQLVDTTRDDIEFERDFMLPIPKAGHRNVKVVVNGTCL